MDYQDLETVWNEAEELSCSLRELTDDEYVECRDALMNRVKIIMQLCGENLRGDYNEKIQSLYD